MSKVLHEFSKKITCELYIYMSFCFVLEQLTYIIIYEMRQAKAINLEMGGRDARAPVIKCSFRTLYVRIRRAAGKQNQQRQRQE